MDSYAEFMDCEYLTFNRRKHQALDFQQAVIASNQMDSQEFKSAKRTGYSKLQAYYELFAKSTSINKLSI